MLSPYIYIIPQSFLLSVLLLMVKFDEAQILLV